MQRCGGHQPGCLREDAKDDTRKPPAQALPAMPTTKPKRLVIRIWSGDEQQVYAETAGKAFTADTGIPIVWDTTDEAVSYAKVNQQISSGETPHRWQLQRAAARVHQCRAAIDDADHR